MTPIHNIDAIITSALTSLRPESPLRESKRRIQQLLTHLDTHILTAREAIATHATTIIPEDATIITLSYSTTVLQALLHAHREKPIRRVLLSESRPLREGVKLARHLHSARIPVTLVTDAALPSLYQEVDPALVGADAILRDGSLVHKIGTYPLALTAQDLKKPFYVTTDALKIQGRGVKYPLRIEEKPASEITQGQKLAGVKVRNVYFDVTPARLITALITEFGTVNPSNSSKIAARLYDEAFQAASGNS